MKRRKGISATKRTVLNACAKVRRHGSGRHITASIHREPGVGRGKSCMLEFRFAGPDPERKSAAPRSSPPLRFATMDQQNRRDQTARLGSISELLPIKGD